MEGRQCYVPKMEILCNCGISYKAYGIWLSNETAGNTENIGNTGNTEDVENTENAENTKKRIVSDITGSREEIVYLCNLLNENQLELEQARYVIEDFVTEKYLVM